MAIFSERSAFASSHETILLRAGLVMAVFLALFAVSAAARPQRAGSRCGPRAGPPTRVASCGREVRMGAAPNAASDGGPRRGSATRGPHARPGGRGRVRLTPVTRLTLAWTLPTSLPMQCSRASELLRRAHRRVGLACGNDGIILTERPHEPSASDVATHLFLWRELRNHPSLLFCEIREDAVHNVALLNPDIVCMVANAWLIAALCGVRELVDEIGLPMLSTPEVASLFQLAAQCGMAGVLQHRLTKVVHIPANKLAYQLSMLEMDGVLQRQVVYIVPFKRRCLAEGIPNLTAGTSANMIRTNLLRLPTLRQGTLQTLAAPIMGFVKSNDGHSSLLSQMVAVLDRAPSQMLPLRRLRHMLHLAGKGIAANTWIRLRFHALSASVIEEIRYRTHFDGTRDRASRCGIRLLRLPVSPRPPTRLDRPPTHQMIDTLSSACAQRALAGKLAASFTAALSLHPRHTAKLTDACVADFGVICRPEQFGRAKTYRYFPHNHVESVVRAAGIFAQDSEPLLAEHGETLQLALRKCAPYQICLRTAAQLLMTYVSRVRECPWPGFGYLDLSRGRRSSSRKQCASFCRLWIAFSTQLAQRVRRIRQIARHEQRRLASIAE